jgi:hypothetical protein
MARFDHLHEQGYERLERDVRAKTELPHRPRRKRVRVAGTMWKIGFWTGGIADIFAFSSRSTSEARGLIFVAGMAGGIALGLLGLLIDGLTALADGSS